MTMNAAQLLLADHPPGRVALVCGDAQMTYGELRDAVARAGAAWRGLGAGIGTPVAIKIADGIDWVVAYLGAIWAGAVAVGVNPRVASDEWRRIAVEAGFRFVLADAADDVASALALSDWTRVLRRAAPMAAQPMDDEAPALWSHSSGTSGAPKAVIHAHRCARDVERVAADLLGVTHADRLFASSRMFFLYPVANSLFAGFKLGATVIVDAAWPSAEQVIATILRTRPSVFFSVPSLFRALLHDGHCARLADSGIRLAVSAGEALPQSLREQWQHRTRIPIVNGYGASETLTLALVDSGAGLRPAPGVAISPLRPGEPAPARILIRMPTLALGYFNRPAAQAEGFRDGGFSPADLFEQEHDGRWRFAGREDALVKVRGRWVDLVELEELVAAGCPGIAEAAAVAVPDAEGVTEIALVYARHPDAGYDVGAALGALVQAMPPHRRARWVHEVVSLPRTATGKLLRRQLRDVHESRLAAATTPAGMP
jgi:acyl-coenzyme A synthetase/AMP-(fatty) acid ligase